MGTIALYIIIGLLGLWLLGNLCTSLLQDFFIFRPEKLDADYRFEFEAPYQEITLNTVQGGRINALWFLVEPGRVSKRCILYFHGNKGSLKRWAHLYHYFFRFGYDFFIIDYRSYGKSRGPKGQQNMYADALAAYEWTRQHYPAEQITLFGRSLGCAFATFVAARQPARQLILETPFSSMKDLFFAYFPFLPKIFFFKYHFSNKKQLPQISYPVTIFQGDRDLVVPLKVAEKLRPYLKADDAFFVVEGGSHNNLMHYDLYNWKMKAVLEW